METENVENIFKKIIGTKDLASSIGGTANKTAGAIVDGSKSAINTTVETTGNVAHSAYDHTGKALHTVAGKSSDVIHNVWDGTKNTASYIADGTKNAATNVADGTKSAASTVYDGTKNVAAAGAEKAGSAWEGRKIGYQNGQFANLQITHKKSHDDTPYLRTTFEILARNLGRSK